MVQAVVVQITVKASLLRLLRPKGGGQLGGLGAQEGDVQRLRLLVGVFDFELGQRGAAVEAPVDGLEATVDVAALHDLLERADFVGFVAEVHGAVGMGPVGQHAQALEVGALAVDLFGGVDAGLGLHVVAAEVAAEGLLDLVLDGQAVAVPAGHVDGVHALELARLDDHVLEDLVDGVTDVDVAVGIRRAVVQHELGAPWRAARSVSYRPFCSHSATQPGSRLGKSPRIGKGVSGMFSVARYLDSGTASADLAPPFLASCWLLPGLAVWSWLMGAQGSA
jgi:hypothetical protein